MSIRNFCGALIVLSLVAGGAHGQDDKLGREIFTEKADPPCALCHTLKDAAAEGEIGPNLDDLKPDADKVRQAVVNGVGAMPPYGESLDKAQIDAVAQYVAGVVGAAKK